MRYLNKLQLDRLSEIFGNLGLLFLGSMVLPFLTGIEKPNIILSGLGLILSMISWSASILMLKGVKL